MKQIELAESLWLKSIYGFIEFAIAIYLTLRAVFIPLVHDEAATFFHYIHSFDFIPFIAHWDANNPRSDIRTYNQLNYSELTQLGHIYNLFIIKLLYL